MKRIFRNFPIFEIYRIVLFCNLFMEWPTCIYYLALT